jgi:hypothetical protein
MESPGVMFIEMAQDWLKELKDDPQRAWLFESQQSELTSFGDVRAQQLGATGISEDFRVGYELGLQTMRALIKTNVAAQNAKIDV